MADLISAADIEKNLKKVPEWELEDKAIVRTVEFDGFIEGVEFVNGVAEIAEEAQHHPDIDIRYNQVTLRLTTHSKGGITSADFELASRIDTLLD